MLRADFKTVLVREVQDPRSGHRICRTVVARHIEWQRQVVQETLCFEEHNTQATW
jgi:hypothetical protein